MEESEQELLQEPRVVLVPKCPRTSHSAKFVETIHIYSLKFSGKAQSSQEELTALP